MDNKQLRQTAFIVKISDLKNGKYIKEEGWEPNYILTKKARVNRANILGIVISKTETPDMSYKSLVIDDGSGNISVRLFENNNLFNGINVGDIILLIGRPREYGTEKYMIPEIIKKIDNGSWLNYRKKELELFDAKNKTVECEEVTDVETETLSEEHIGDVLRHENLTDRIIGLIKKT